jgi:quinol monooxygenase YgiN
MRSGICLAPTRRGAWRAWHWFPTLSALAKAPRHLYDAHQNQGDSIVIHIIAILTAKPGQRGAVLAAFHDNMKLVHAEPGCLEYVPVIDTPDMGRIQTKLGDDSFAVIEKWESPAALMAHAAAPHMAAYGAKTKDLLVSRVIHVLSPA